MPILVKYTMMVIHIIILIENNFFGSLLLQNDRNQILKNKCKFSGPAVVSIAFFRLYLSQAGSISYWLERAAHSKSEWRRPIPL
jgi:hypothetical protein